MLNASGSSLVVEVSGIGYLVNATPAFVLACREGDEVHVHTNLVVREDSLTLFGFASRDELEVFALLIGVTGVGPKSALGVLSAMSPTDVARAVEADDDAAFRRVSGIGPKTAKLITVSLAGKVVAPVASAPGAGVATGGVADDVLAALTGLGWSERLAGEAIAQTLEASGEAASSSVPVLLRLTLARLGPAQQGARVR
ncbi:Holliday junction ATP-dependent DNA helicase RuvA [Agromyces marinus]|uniref:Holliday junction branch migration complex subunit RuvA n=1 Tax=Agromyces marinus TaxID=1389020 RepID=A0ABM8H643_9MICO|nr:Holliday junction branch migration protein RuvA [Agromyces marinus]BDZ56291.1 Holliday junction ATP-dependent DNA helicase RuvA [Agromyces marinus]